MTVSGPLAGRTEQDWAAEKDGVILSFRAGALILCGGKLLVAKSAHHACYYTIGGGIRVGESSEAAVMREVYEHWIPLDAIRTTNLVPPFLKTVSLEHISGVTHIISHE